MKNSLGVLALMAFGTASIFAAPVCSVTTGSNNLIAGLTSGLVTPTGNPPTSNPNVQDNPCTPTGSTLTFSNFTYDLDAGSFTTAPASVTLENASQTGGIVNFGFS